LPTVTLLLFRAPQPKERVRSSPLANPRHQSSLLEESEGSDDDELTGAYTRQLQQRTPPLGGYFCLHYS